MLRFLWVWAALGAVACSGALAPSGTSNGPRGGPDRAVLRRVGGFEFHGGFWMDLHHFLYVAARSRNGERDASRSAVEAAPRELESAGFRPDERAAVDEAIETYRRTLARRDLVFDAEAIRVTDGVAALDDGGASTASGARGFPDAGIARALDLAAPGYRRTLWPTHLARHPAWLSEAAPLLEAHGTAMARGLAAAYGTSWPTAPIRVDLVAFANWAGAYTVSSSRRITMSSLAADYRAPGCLELLFHEASHLLDPQIDGRFEAEARAQGKSLPSDLTHAVIFESAGVLAARELPGYVPHAERNGFWTRRPWPAYRPLLTENWDPHLEGRFGVEEAVRRLIAALP
ncbi:MAG: hypothetical protein ABI592_05020 [Acidobacteriota bacterium]